MSSRVLKNILLGFLFFTSLGLYSQTTYYVSKLGNNSNAGNFGAPFLTVSHAVSVINPGDQIYIREGIYHENIVLNNIDASNGNETLISNYNNEEVIIDGTSNIPATMPVHASELYAKNISALMLYITKENNKTYFR